MTTRELLVKTMKKSKTSTAEQFDWFVTVYEMLEFKSYEKDFDEKGTYLIDTFAYIYKNSDEWKEALEEALLEFMASHLQVVKQKGIEIHKMSASELIKLNKKHSDILPFKAKLVVHLPWLSIPITTKAVTHLIRKRSENLDGTGIRYSFSLRLKKLNK